MIKYFALVSLSVLVLGLGGCTGSTGSTTYTESQVAKIFDEQIGYCDDIKVNAGMVSCHRQYVYIDVDFSPTMGARLRSEFKANPETCDERDSENMTQMSILEGTNWEATMNGLDTRDLEFVQGFLGGKYSTWGDLCMEIKAS